MGQMGSSETTMGQQGQNASLATMDPTTSKLVLCKSAIQTTKSA